MSKYGEVQDYNQQGNYGVTTATQPAVSFTNYGPPVTTTAQGIPAYGVGAQPTAPPPPYSATTTSMLPPEAYAPGYSSSATYGVAQPVVCGSALPASELGAMEAAANKPQTFGFSERSIRQGFIRKVFGILGVQLLVTAGIMALFMYQPAVRDFVQTYWWMYLIAICVYLVVVIALSCAKDLRRKSPYNFIFLGIVTVAMSWMLGTIATYYSVDEALIAIAITFGVVIVCAAFGLQTKFDFTPCIGVVLALAFTLLFFGLFAAIPMYHSKTLYLFYAAIGAFVFSLFLIIDIQLVIGGKRAFQIGEEEYILAALNIYLDVATILMYILVLAGACKK